MNADASRGRGASSSGDTIPNSENCRVEVWRGGLGRCLCSLLARPFVCGCHIISTMLRFHTPLIKPDLRVILPPLSQTHEHIDSRAVDRWNPKSSSFHRLARRLALTGLLALEAV